MASRTHRQILDELRRIARVELEPREIEEYGCSAEVACAIETFDVYSTGDSALRKALKELRSMSRKSREVKRDMVALAEHFDAVDID